MESLPGPITFVGEGIGVMTAGRLTAMKEAEESKESRWDPQDPFTRAMLNIPRERLLSFVILVSAFICRFLFYTAEALTRYTISTGKCFWP